MKNKDTVKLIALIFSFIISFSGFLYLFQYDWKLTLAIAAIMWGNNISNRYN